MVEVKQRGERVIQRDVLAQRHRLNERQGKALGHLMQNEKLTIQDFEALCPDVNRRSLLRDLKLMVDKELLRSEGATSRLVYKIAIDPDIKERYLHEFPKIDLLYYYFFDSLLTGV